MDYLLVYLWTRLTIIQGLFLGMAFCLLMGLIIWLVTSASEGNTDNYFKETKKFIIALAICTSIGSLTPNKADFLLIYLVPKLIHSEGAIDSMEILNKLPKVVRLQIEKYLDDEDNK